MNQKIKFNKTNEANYNSWITLFDDEFNDELLLYHYTSFNTACKILDGNTFKFSNLSLTNDPVESKPKITARSDSAKKNLATVLSHFEKVNKNNLKLLCFSKDTKINDEIKKSNKNVLRDYTGRGFSLPRMWAQYGDNNRGVCFIVNKKKLLHDIDKKALYRNRIIYYDDVLYRSFFSPYYIKNEELKDLTEYFSTENILLDFQFIKDNINFIKFNYFCKAKDWEHENEFRILGFNSGEITINYVSNYIEGIIIGENMDDTNSKLIYLLNDNKKPLYRIKFNFDASILENVNF